MLMKALIPQKIHYHSINRLKEQVLTNKQGRSIQIRPDNSDRDNTNGQGDKKANTLINQDTSNIQ